MRYLNVMILTVVMLVGTWFAGWMAVPVAAAIYALVRRDARSPREAAVAALVAWGALLVNLARSPAFTTLVGQLGQIFPGPGAAVAAVTLLLAVVLAASAARVVSGIVGLRAGV
jgi:hypothetical protein